VHKKDRTYTAGVATLEECFLGRSWLLDHALVDELSKIHDGRVPSSKFLEIGGYLEFYKNIPLPPLECLSSFIAKHRNTPKTRSHLTRSSQSLLINQPPFAHHIAMQMKVALLFAALW
jgi:hypothetical protein